MSKRLIFLISILPIVISIWFITKAVLVLAAFIVLVLCAMVFIALDDI